jgi:hypothetical protein
MMDYVFKKNDIEWLNMWMMMLFLMNSIYVNTHEGDRNGNRKERRANLRSFTNTS